MGKAFLRYRNPRRREVGSKHRAFYAQAWEEAAAELGASCESLGAGILDIQLGGVHARVVENTTEIDGPVTLAVLIDKALTYDLLEKEGLPTPRHLSFSLGDMAPAAAFLRQQQGDCVVKPSGGTGGGRGVRTGIRTEWHLAQAAAAGAVYADRLLIEEQVEGDNYRLLYLDGELIDAFIRRPPTVVGDGRSTIARLVHQMNAERLRQGVGLSQVLLTVDLDLRRTLARQGLSLGSVPRSGQRVILKTVVNENGGDDNSTATGLLCRSIIEDGERAVRALRVRLAGVDIITRNPAVPLTKSGGVFLEVNAPPNFYYHYRKRDGAFPVASHVLRRLLLEQAGGDAAAGVISEVESGKEL
jgi:cyanophycin synthetase